MMSALVCLKYLLSTISIFLFLGVYITLSIVFIICVFYIIIASLLIHGARTVSLSNILQHLQNYTTGPPWLPDPLAVTYRHLHELSGAACYWWSDISSVGEDSWYHRWAAH